MLKIAEVCCLLRIFRINNNEDRVNHDGEGLKHD